MCHIYLVSSIADSVILVNILCNAESDLSIFLLFLFLKYMPPPLFFPGPHKSETLIYRSSLARLASGFAKINEKYEFHSLSPLNPPFAPCSTPS